MVDTDHRSTLKTRSKGESTTPPLISENTWKTVLNVSGLLLICITFIDGILIAPSQRVSEH
jgi:hypothetical protein